MKLTLFLLAAAFQLQTGHATVIYHENFEGTVIGQAPSGWFRSTSNSYTSGIAVVDNAGNHALRLTATNYSSGGWIAKATYNLTGPLPSGDLNNLVLTATLRGSAAGSAIFTLDPYVNGSTTQFSGKWQFAETAPPIFEKIGGTYASSPFRINFTASANNYALSIWMNDSASAWSQGSSAWLEIDDISLSSVPEPSATIIAFGGLFLCFRRNRKS